MHESLLILLLLAAIIGCAVVAKRLRLPYPIVFVIGGVLLALVPDLPEVRLDPNWVLFIFLPPLLYSGGWLTDWITFKQNARPIGLLAVGLVVFTTGIVAVAAHHLLPQIGWAPAFALGAIVSPPDAVAASAVFERFPVPRRIAAILDGEGLMNDATALVIYRFAVVATLTGTFSVISAGVNFLFVAIGGVVVGLLLGAGFVRLQLLLNKLELADEALSVTLSLLVPYAIYLAGDALQVSGVLATVTAGIFVSRRSSKMFTPDARLVAYSVWNLLIFLLNGLVFLLIGLQVRDIVHEPTFALKMLWVGVEICAIVIVVRFVWVFVVTYGTRVIVPGVARREGWPAVASIFVLAWSGMRGIVTLAAALALPFYDSAGRPFPSRSAIVFISLCVVFATLVFQGLSLIPILKILDIGADEDLDERNVQVRVAALRAGIARLRELEPTFDSTTEWEVEGRILHEYENRIGHLVGHGGDGAQDEVNVDHRLEREALDAERAEIVRMRAAGEIPDDVYRRVEYDLDLATARLT